MDQARLIGSFGIAFVLLPLAGCRLLVSQTISEVEGAKAIVRPIVDASSGSLAAYNSVRFEPAASETGDSITPSPLLRAYDRGALEGQTKGLSQAFPGGEPALVVRTIMYYFQARDLIPGSTAEAIGRARVQGDGGLVADLILRAESESYRAGDEGALGLALAEAVVDYLLEKKGHKPPAE